MLEENQRTLIGMSELVFFLNKDNKGLKFENENLIAQIKVKNDLLESWKKLIEQLKLENNKLEENIKEMENKSKVEDDCFKLREEIKQKDNLIKLYEEQLKKYRKEEKKREKISKALGEVMEEERNK